MLRRRSTTQEVVEGIHINSAQARVMLSGNDELTLAAADLVEGVERVGESMRETTGAAESAADATSHVEAGASAVASASSQIAVAMQEVSSSAASATIVTSEAAIITTQARESVELLVASSQEITGVIVTVNKIADQTRMLALNATIEATRAGDSGHGFAVVAEEVKNLSSLTGQATTEIGDQLDALITNAESVRAGFARIDEVLGRIDELQHTIAAAVEEETAAIAEITRAADQAALAAQDLEQSVSSSANAARVAASAVDRSRTWLERVAAALESQRHAMTTLSDNVEVHPLHAAVKAHAAWKTNLRLAAETGRVPAGIDRTKAGRSDACAFGKWLVAGEGDAADPKHAPRVAELHARFHQAASAILETAVSGRTEDARQMLADEHGYRDISNELIDALLEWLSSVE